MGSCLGFSLASLCGPVPRDPESCVQGISHILFSPASWVGTEHPGLLERSFFGPRVSEGPHCMWETVKRALRLGWGWLRDRGQHGSP